jgi:Acetyltransferase (GNAT) domain
MRVEVLTIDDSRWINVLSRLRHDFYDRSDYVKLDAARVDARPEGFLAEEGDRRFFVPYLLRSCDHLTTTGSQAILDAISPYGYGGILVNEAGRIAGFVAAGLDAYRHTLANRNVCSAFLRMHPILSADWDAFFPPDTFVETGETVAIDLSLDENALWKNLRHGHQETIKKCRKLGHVARFVPAAKVLDEFEVLYEQTMDRVNAKDAFYFDRDYFAALASMPDVHCCVVERDSIIAAACLFFECGGIVQAHLGGTRTEFLTKSPFHMTIYQAALWAKARGNRWLHLGGGVGGANDSLLHFKAGFSPARFRFLTSRLIINARHYRDLVEQRARMMNLPCETLLASSYFPAYRSV